MATTTPNYHLRKPTNADTVNVATDISGNMDLLDAHGHSGTYERVFGVEAYGATASTTPAQNSVAFQAAVDASVAAGSKLVSFARSYQFSATVQINDAGVVFRGPSPDNAVTLTWTGGAGTAIQIGTDNGHAYDAGDYDGPSGFTLENINLTAGVTGLVALDNGLGNYVPSSYGIRDWRGGNVTLRHARLVSWDVPFWGIQSDFDRWDDVIIHKAHSGVYLGPRSDQLVGTAVYFLQCDRALDLDSCWQPRFYGASFVDNGAAATNPIRIRSQFARCATAVNFDDCWFEHLTTGLAAAAVEAFVEIGVGDTNTASGITFTRPKILNNQSGTPPRVQYFAKIGKADLVVIDTPQGDANQFDNILRFVGSSNPGVRTRYDHALTLAAAAKYSNGGSGAPTVLAEDIGLGRFGIGDGTGREAFRFTPGNSPQLNIVDPVGGGDIHRMTWTTQDAGQLFIDLAASTSQLHIRDAIGSGNDMLRIQPSTGLYLGYAGFKVGFYGTTPATQPAGSVDVLAGLVTLGLRAASSNPPLNLGSGALTAGAATLAATTVTTLGTGGLVTLADGNNVAVGTTTGTQIGTGATQKLGFFGATPVVQRPATTDIKQVLVDLGLLVGAGSTGINLNGGNLFTSGTVSGTGGTTAGSNTTAGNANINGPAASARQLLYQTAGSNRWLLRANSTAEGGSNAGSDFEVAARDDSGAALSTALIIRRSDARATFAGEVVTPLSTTTRAGLNVPHGAAPTSPADGDVWTTTAGLFVRINGVTKTVTLT